MIELWKRWHFAVCDFWLARLRYNKEVIVPFGKGIIMPQRQERSAEILFFCPPHKKPVKRPCKGTRKPS